MNASSAINPTSPVPTRPTASPEQLPIPAKWRIGQFVALALVVLMAVYYNTIGWKIPPGGTDRAQILMTDQFGFIVLAGLIWLTTPTTAVIAFSSLQEALRRRWVLGFLAFSMLAIALSSNFTFVQLGEEERFLQDFGTGFIVGMTILLAVFLGVAMIPPEVERRTILAILSKPVNRLEFLLGKFLGLCLTLLFCLVLMGVFFLFVFAVYTLRHEGWQAAWQADTAGAGHAALGFSLAQIAKALILHYGQLIILSALALTFSVLVTPITAITFCSLAYFGGQMSSYWGHLSGEGHSDEDSAVHGLSKPMQGVLQVLYYALPRLDHFDVRQRLVTDTLIPFAFVWKAWSAGLVYVAVLITIAFLVFSDREF